MTDPMDLDDSDPTSFEANTDDLQDSGAQAPIPSDVDEIMVDGVEPTEPGFWDLDTIMADRDQVDQLDEPTPPPFGAQPTLDGLPAEIYIMIGRHLPFQDIMALFKTSRGLRSKIQDPRAIATKPALHSFFATIEQAHRNDGLLSCHSCFRVLPSSEFGDAQRRGRRGKHGQRIDLHVQRFCWTCTREKRLYGHLEPVKKGGLRWYLCHHCGEFRTKSQRCVMVRWIEENGEMGMICSNFAENAKNGAEENMNNAESRKTDTPNARKGPTSPATTRPQAQKYKLDALPDKALLRIASHLDYRTAIHLSQVNRHFHALVKPQDCCSFEAKWAAMRSLLLSGVYNLNSGTLYDFALVPALDLLPCYGCFRWLPHANFTPSGTKLPRPLWYSQRCKRCLHLHGLGCMRPARLAQLAPGQQPYWDATLAEVEAGKKARLEFLRQRPCQICGELRREGVDCATCAWEAETMLARKEEIRARVWHVGRRFFNRARTLENPLPVMFDGLVDWMWHVGLRDADDPPTESPYYQDAEEYCVEWDPRTEVEGGFDASWAMLREELLRGRQELLVRAAKGPMPIRAADGGLRVMEGGTS